MFWGSGTEWQLMNAGQLLGHEKFRWVAREGNHDA